MSGARTEKREKREKRKRREREKIERRDKNTHTHSGQQRAAHSRERRESETGK
jgi:hypothetical protein